VLSAQLVKGKQDFKCSARISVPILSHVMSCYKDVSMCVYCEDLLCIGGRWREFPLGRNFESSKIIPDFMLCHSGGEF
jgi:hypothetical protein